VSIEALSIGDTNKIKYLITDCDGVLTDGNYYSNENGKQFITFSAKDSVVPNLARRTDLKVIVISSTSIPHMVEKRARDWNIEFHHAKPYHKLDKVRELVDDLSTVAYIGDSVDDIQVFDEVGLAFAPADAVEQTKKHADYVLERRGGEGCLLEVFLGLRFRDEDWTKFRPD
jgi:YrbI family 3-deoxy-D-manno-octulosonate 8-phosphate phosphatase